jgi:hypothetical protein
LSKRTAILLLLVLFAAPCLAQRKQRVPVCRATTFAAFKALPELRYDCPDGLSESDDKILKLPERVEALSILTYSSTLSVTAQRNKLRLHEPAKCC